jgi:hypothetical protein
MQRRSTKAIIRARTTGRKDRRNSNGVRRQSATKRAGMSKSRVRIKVRYRGSRISRARLRTMREDLAGTQNAVSNAFEKFWTTPETHIRETLAKTQQRIGRAVRLLQKAA